MVVAKCLKLIWNHSGIIRGTYFSPFQGVYYLYRGLRRALKPYFDLILEFWIIQFIVQLWQKGEPHLSQNVTLWTQEGGKLRQMDPCALYKIRSFAGWGMMKFWGWIYLAVSKTIWWKSVSVKQTVLLC